MATYNSNQLTVSQLVVDMVNTYGYRSTDYGFIANSNAGTVHFIWGITDPGTGITGVPVGSVFFNVANGKVFVKTNSSATQGVGFGTSGTWTQV